MLPLSQRILEGDKRSLARAISMLERAHPQAVAVMGDLHPHTGRAFTVGVTGPPGAGKSTLIARLARLLRDRGHSVGIIAVDPTSPFTGGALLGDRIRMESLYMDPGVFIRSMATKGAHGGVPRIVKGAVRLLDAYGADVALVETVGVGQTELEIMGVADTVVVVMVPEGGDGVQALKAGLMEIADLYVVNKADRPGAQRMAQDIRSYLSIGSGGGDGPRRPEVVMAQAVNGAGVEETWAAIERRRDYLAESSLLDRRRAERRSRETLELVREELNRRVRRRLTESSSLKELLSKVERGEVDPHAAASEFLARLDGDEGLDGNKG